jgi:hypothetical protein
MVTMIKDEYRQHMRKYSRDTAVMSFVVTDHLDYKALQAAGSEIIPWLLADLLDPDWHCNTCYGQGYEFVPSWRDEYERGWENNRVLYPPRSTGNACPECKGKGNICSWACMTLLFEKTRANGDAPIVEKWMQGRLDALSNLWRKWGEQRGYLPPTPEDGAKHGRAGRGEPSAIVVLLLRLYTRLLDWIDSW